MTNRELINKFKDYAGIADASYAMLHWVFENEENEIYDNLLGVDRWKYADNITLGDKVKGNNTAYARCIEARFMKDIILEKGTFKDTTINNDPKNIPLDATLSLRTINFTNRYKLLAHQPNTEYGFSATLFKDTQSCKQKNDHTICSFWNLSYVIA